MGGAESRAAARAWRAPDLPRSEHRGRLVARRVLRPALALLALFEAITVAVHFKDVDVVGQPIEQCAGQPLGPEHAGPFVERQIGSDNDRAALVTLAEDLEQQLRAGRRQRYIAELVDDQQLVGRQLALETEQSLLVPGLDQLVDHRGRGGEADRQALLTGRQPQPEAMCVLPVPLLPTAIAFSRR